MARTRPNKNRKFPYDPFMLGLIALGWIGQLGPKVQAVVASGTKWVAPKLYSTVIDHLWGDDDGDESALWVFLQTQKPDELTQEQHEAWANLVECTGRTSADWVEGLPQCIEEGIAAGKPDEDIVKECRALINQALDEHDFESDIATVVRAMKE